MTDSRDHWNSAYATKGETGVSWFQERPQRSLTLIEAHAPERSASIIDVGGGASRLVDHLLAAGYEDLAVLDLSAVALTAAKARLGQEAAKVEWVAADVTAWQPMRTWSVWHDRGVFHFLTSPPGQDAYLRAL